MKVDSVSWKVVEESYSVLVHLASIAELGSAFSKWKIPFYNSE
jgi:hypothetical protein